MGPCRQTIVLLGLGLVSLSGCATPEPPPAAPPPPPPPPATRALVEWADTLCGTVTSVDGLRTEIDSVNQAATAGGNPAHAAMSALAYLTQIPQSVTGNIEELGELEPTGVAAADNYRDGLVRALEQLPKLKDTAITTASDEQKLAKARQVAAAIARLEPQAPKLAGVAAATPDLLASYHLAPGCAPLPQAPPAAEGAPTRPLVGWANGMCEGMRLADSLETDPLADLISADPRFARFATVEVAQYITSAKPSVSQLVETLAPLAPTGVRAADDYRNGLLSAARSALPKIPEDTGFGQLHQLPLDELKARATEVAGTLATVKPDRELADIAAADPLLAASYNLAPSCEPLPAPGAPTTPEGQLPPAADGTDLGTCADGQCQVQVSGTVELTAAGLSFTLEAGNGRVIVTDETSRMQLGDDGTGSIGKSGKKVTFEVAGVNDTAAVLDISSS